MLRPLPQVPQGYSPGSLQTTDMIDRYPQLSDSSDSSNSPDSLYSSESPTMPMISTDHLDNFGYGEDFDEHEEDEYEHLLDGANPFADSGEMTWTPSPKDSPPRKLSIISNSSPRGSISGRGDSLLKAALLLQGRRSSTPSLRDSLDARRRSSTRSFASSATRRSSAFSNNGSFLDLLEEDRMRSFAAMDLLSRHFSEVIEVSHDGAYGDAYLARDRLQSPWSESSVSSLDDLELRTASYAPTPELQSTQGLVSNYPLASVAETAALDTSSATLSTGPLLSERPSPAIPPRLVQPQSSIAILTPPAPPQPSTMWRERNRPLHQWQGQDYQFPARLPPAGAARPAWLNRSISAPFFSSSEKDRPYAEAFALRAAGTFTMARPLPLGTTPLRASTRRESIMSILSDVSPMYSRRSSMIVEQPSPSERMDLDRRFSNDFGGSDHGSNRHVNGAASRSIQLDGQNSQLRRDSTRSSFLSTGRRKSSGVDLRRESLDRRASLANARSSIDLPTGWKMRRGVSATRSQSTSRRSSDDRRMSLASSRKSSTNQRASLSSRKSSVVSFGEYGYLASQIVVPSINGRMRSIPALTISLPPRGSPSWSLVTPATEDQTPMPSRPNYNLMTSFLGHAMGTPEERHIDPMDSIADTPKADSGRESVLNRPRPVRHAEYMDNRVKSERIVSPKAPSKQTAPILSSFAQSAAPATSPIKSILKAGGVTRKPVPTINLDSEDLGVRTEVYHQAQRRGAMERFDEDSVDPLEVPIQGQTLKRSSSLTMVPTYTTPAGRPRFKRHMTEFSLHGTQETPGKDNGKAGRQGQGNHFGRFFKW